MLLALIGTKALQSVVDLCSPDSPNAKTYPQLLELLRAHYGKKTTKSFSRAKFHEARQEDAESIDEFSVRLRRLAIDFKFEANLEDRLRDQLIVGVRNESLRKKLFEGEDKSFTDCVKISQTFETVHREIRSSGYSSKSVNS